MSDITRRVEKDITGEVIRATNLFGIDETPLKIYMALFFADEPSGLSEISEKTGYSISTVSNNMPLLERLCDVRRFSKPGSKKIYWECFHDVDVIQKKKMREAMRTVQNISNAVDRAFEALGNDDSEKARRIESHLGKWKTAYANIDRVYGMFMKMRGLRDGVDDV